MDPVSKPPSRAVGGLRPGLVAGRLADRVRPLRRQARDLDGEPRRIEAETPRAELPPPKGQLLRRSRLSAWSPDGTRIAFGQATLRGGKAESAEIFVMNANGTGVRRVTQITAGKPFAMDVLRPAYPTAISWSSRCRTSGRPNRRTVTPCSSSMRTARPPPADALSLNAGDDPDWSPDGKLILFAPSRPRIATTATSTRLGPTDRPRMLTNYLAPKTVGSPTFSPDGKWIAFSRFTEGRIPPSTSCARTDRRPPRHDERRCLRARLVDRPEGDSSSPLGARFAQ